MQTITLKLGDNWYCCKFNSLRKTTALLTLSF